MHTEMSQEKLDNTEIEIDILPHGPGPDLIGLPALNVKETLKN